MKTSKAASELGTRIAGTFLEPDDPAKERISQELARVIDERVHVMRDSLVGCVAECHMAAGLKNQAVGALEDWGPPGPIVVHGKL